MSWGILKIMSPVVPSCFVAPLICGHMASDDVIIWKVADRAYLECQTEVVCILNSVLRDEAAATLEIESQITPKS